MKNDFVYITDKAWFETSALKNPCIFQDNKMEKYFPYFYSAEYDLKLLATKAPTDIEKKAPFYNDYREKFASKDIEVLKIAAESSPAKTVLLSGFGQEQFEYIAELIKETAEVLYLFKCPNIKNLSMLADFKQLKCLLIYWNNSVECLWNMKNNINLKVISFVSVTKLRDVAALAQSRVEYVAFDSADNCGNKKDLLFDRTIFEKTPNLKHLTLEFKGCKEDY